MHFSARRIAILAAAAGLTLAGSAQAAPTRSFDVTGTASTVTWNGVAGNGLNTSYFLDTGPAKGTCGSSLQDMCETTLIHATAKDVSGGTITFRIDGFGQASDFDLRVYESDETGAVGAKLGTPASDNGATSPLGGNDPRNTGAGDYETTAVPVDGYVDETTNKLDAYFLVMVPYFMVANDTYKGHASLAPTPAE